MLYVGFLSTSFFKLLLPVGVYLSVRGFTCVHIHGTIKLDLHFSEYNYCFYLVNASFFPFCEVYIFILFLFNILKCFKKHTPSCFTANNRLLLVTGFRGNYSVKLPVTCSWLHPFETYALWVEETAVRREPWWMA